LAAVAPGWSFGVQSLQARRESVVRQNLTPLLSVAVVAGALLLMVALGLTGIVWQSVTQRMREFGLRRAQGATAAAIGRQVVAELVVMSSFAIAVGCLLLAQIPLLPIPPDIMFIPRHIFAGGVGFAVLAVYALTMLCAWYPSRMATRVAPVDALHYE
jgi:putative ABC transport system permease protein